MSLVLVVPAWLVGTAGPELVHVQVGRAGSVRDVRGQVARLIIGPE